MHFISAKGSFNGYRSRFHKDTGYGENGFIGLHTVLHFLKSGDTLEQAQFVLGWQARPYEGTIIATAQSLIEQSMV